MAGRGRLIDVLGAGLVERQDELRAIQALVDDAAAGTPRVVLLRGEAGHGKTSLVAVAAELGRRSGLDVLTARGTAIERTLAYGVVRQALLPVLPRLDAGVAEALLAGPLRAALAEHPAPLSRDPDAAHGVHLGLVALVRAAAAGRPLLLLVDDAHWADAASLHALAVLAGHLSGAQAGILLAARPPAAGDPPGPLDALAADPVVRAVELGPLSAVAVATLLAARTGAAVEPVIATAVHEVTGGVAFYVDALAAELTRDPGLDGPRIRGLTPTTVRRRVVLQLGALGPDAIAFARALAVLGDQSAGHRVGALAGLDAAAAGAAHDRLVAAGVVAGPVATPVFCHPIVGAAVLADMPASLRAESHAQAAAVLRDGHAATDRIAAHLLPAPPADDAATVDVLTRAADEAVARGAQEEALLLLERALAEPPAPGPALAGVLLRLAGCELLTGRPAAVERLAQAREAAAGGPLEVPVLLASVASLAMLSRLGEAVEVAAAARARGLPDPVLLRLDGLIGLSGRSSRAFQDDAVAAIERLRAAEAGGRTDPVGNAVLALHDALAGAPAAVVVPRVARLEELPPDVDEVPVRYPALHALVVVGDYAGARRAIDRLTERSVQSGSRMSAAAAAVGRALLCHAEGHVTELHAAATEAKALGEEVRFPMGATLGAALLAYAELERGDVAAATSALAQPPPPGTPEGPRYMHEHAAALVLAAEGRHAEAARALLDVGARHVGWLAGAPAAMAWRGDAALALLAAGDAAGAAALSAVEVALAREQGVPAALGVALRVHALVTGDVASRAEALAVLDGSGAVLALARALVDEGQARLAAGDAAGAREPLRRALDLAAERGGIVVAAAARRALVAAGARPRRAAVQGLAALTDREARIARLAADGLSNRDIAATEFVTVKTVETHLTNAFRKLGVQERGALRLALEG